LKRTIEKITEHINRDDIKRYLSAKGEIPLDWQKLIEEVIVETLALISPIYAVIHDAVVEEGAVLSLKSYDVELNSKDLARQLSQSSEIWILVATLGHEIERKIKYYFAANPTRGIIMDACGSAIIEAFCDVIEEELMTNDRLLNGKAIPHFTMRFSPGYGDLDLYYQKKLFDVFDFTKKTGIHLSTGSLMIPQKSVLFIVGERHGEDADRTLRCQHKCSTCQVETCIYRSEV